MSRWARAEGLLLAGPCAHAGRGPCKGHIHGHHEDYALPLAVSWLCNRHHRIHHHENPGAGTFTPGLADWILLESNRSQRRRFDLMQYVRGYIAAHTTTRND